MSPLLGAGVVVLAGALLLGLVGQRRLAQRLRRAAGRLGADEVTMGTGLAAATATIERAVDRTVRHGGERSAAEDRLEHALTALPQGVVVYDAEQRIAFRNPVAADYLEARHAEALIEEAISDVATATLSGPSGAVPTRSVDLFGPPRRTLVLRAVRLEDAQRPLGVMVVIDDVTDRRRLEAVRRDFVANISHELKTPVGALALLAETLLS